MTFSTAAASGCSDRRRLELEARQLEHEHVGPRARAVARTRASASSTGVADVAGDDASTPGGAAQRAGQRGHRGLAVGAGDREHLLRRRQRAREELDVADHSTPRATAAAIAGWSLRHARADRDQVGAGERRVGERAGHERHAGQRGGELRRVRRLRRACRRRARARLRARASARATARSVPSPSTTTLRFS